VRQPSVVTPFRPPEPAAVPANGTQPAVPKSETMTITPQIAQEWVTLNTRNRPVRYSRVARFARDMKDGTWVLNGETVKISADGTILDGQHRLYACIQASVAFETFVIRGLPAGAQDTIDTGAARTMGDQFNLRGEAHASILAAVTRWAHKWLRGQRGTGQADAEPTHAEMSALLAAEPRLREAAAWADQARGSFRSVSGSVWGMAWMLFHGSDHLAADVFLEKVLTGADLGEGHPALAFRNRIWKAREGGERLNQHEQLAYLILAWNAFKEDRQIRKLQGPKGKLTPANYPEPK
jgi:hypothetical protein